MSFAEWQKNGWIRPHQPSRQEVAGLVAVIDRDLATSADPNLDDDWRFAIAYNAALQCAALALKAAGFEVPKGGGAHHHTIESLRLTIGDDGSITDPLQAFRGKRAGGIYETTGIASEADVIELLTLAKGLKSRVLVWVAKQRPELLAPEPSSGNAAQSKRRKRGSGQ